jgi:hypothetical protein
MTVITLYQSLFAAFPSYGDDHAGAKLHVVEAVSTGLPAEFSITDARTHESTQLSTGPWLENTLLLFDQAYFAYHGLDRCQRWLVRHATQAQRKSGNRRRTQRMAW